MHEEDPAQPLEFTPKSIKVKMFYKGTEAYESKQALRSLSANLKRILASSIFTITAKDGGDGKLLAYRGILERSPVFAAMCNGPFTEAESRKINLPDDDFFLVVCLIQQLYISKAAKVLGHGQGHPSSVSIDKVVSFGAQLYVLAHKYDIGYLQVKLAEELVDLCADPAQHSTLIKAAAFIYENVPSLDHPFRREFKEEIQWGFYQRGRLGCPDEELEELMMEGGELAADVYSQQAIGLVEGARRLVDRARYRQSLAYRDRSPLPYRVY